MSEELKPCPFCGAKPHRQLGKIWHDSLHGDTHQDTVIKCPHLCVTMQGSEDSVVERWNIRADLLPVVKPLEWVEHCDQTGGCHSVSAYNPNLWGYVIEASEPGGLFGIWSPDEGEGVDDPRLGLDYPTIEAAMAAAQADYDACIHACLDMIDPAALVAGAHEAAAEIANRQAWAHGGAHFNAPEMNSDAIAKSIRDIDLDALAEGET